MTLHPDNRSRNARILEMFRAGKYYSQIAAELGVSKSVVAGVCDRAGARRNPPKPKPKKPTHAERLAGADTSAMTITEIAAFLGIKPRTAKKWVRENSIPYKPQATGAAAHRRNIPGLGGESQPTPKPPRNPQPPRTVFGMAAIPQDPNPMGCRYIHGHAGEPGHRYCGDRRMDASQSYCAEHYALTHVPHSSPAERRAIRAIERIAGRARAA